MFIGENVKMSLGEGVSLVTEHILSVCFKQIDHYSLCSMSVMHSYLDILNEIHTNDFSVEK